MDRVKRFITTLEHLVSTKKKRHIVGGILLSTSVFLGGLALTVMSAKNEENVDEAEID
jgi:hypothetical protein